MQKSIILNRIVFHSCRKILSNWVKTTVYNNNVDNLKIDPSKPVCYVFRHRSLSDVLILENECIKAGLPRPHSFINHNDSDNDNDNDNDEHAFFNLSQQEGLILQRERPGASGILEKLLEQVEKNAINDVQIVPVSIFWGRTPDKEQSALKLLFDWNFTLGGRFRKFFATLVHGRNTLVHFSPALSLRKLTDEGHDHQRTLRKIGRVLRVHFRQLSTSIIGPDLSHRRTLVNGLINSHHIQQAITEEAKSKGITPEEARYTARKYADEIASDFSFSAIRFLDIVLTWFWNKLYNGVSIHNAEPLKELAKTHSIVYVPCHRSHIDYLLLSYVLYYEGLTPPHIAAGINLNMPFVGKVLRKSGAFFMRRTFKGNPLYSSVFHEYIYTLASRGFPMEYFIEGGRSRTGRTLSPKTGMLSISLRSYLRDNRKPVSFVPVYIGYEKLLEVSTYLGELRGKAKKKESPLDILRTLAALKDNFGKVWINFGDPIHLGKFLDQEVPQWRQVNADDLKPAWLKVATNQLARKIVSRINSAATINPVNLVAMALLSTPRHAMGEQELLLQLDTYTSLLHQMPYSNRTVITDLKPATMIACVEELKLVTRQSDSLGDIFRMNDKTAIQMTYYRNNVLHIFAIPSLISCLFVNNNRVSRKEVLRICSILYPYLSSELFIEWRPRAFLKVVSQFLNAMVNNGLILRDGNGHYLRPDTASTAFIQLSVFSRAIIQTLERFYITVSILISHGNGTIGQCDLENQARNLAQRLSIIHGLNAPEFFDKSLFKGFIEALRREKVIEIAENNAITFDHQVIQAAEEAFKVLGPEIRYSIQQPTMATPVFAEQTPYRAAP